MDRNNRNNRGRDDFKKDDFIENIIAIDRVARVVKGGRRFRFRALAVVGDGKNTVGIGVAKGGDVQLAVQKAVAYARKNMAEFELDGESIPHEAQAKVAGADILLMPASEGTGLIAGGVVRTVLETTGIKNIRSKSIGSSNKINSAYATVEALQQLVGKDNWVNKPKEAKKSNSPVEEIEAEETKPENSEVVTKSELPASKSKAVKKGDE